MKLTDSDGHEVFVNPDLVESIHGPMSSYHGSKALIVFQSGRRIEVRESPSAIMDMIDESRKQ